MAIPTTCPDFVSHPHIVEKINCYTCQASLASEEQGTSQIAEALLVLGVPCEVHQTGGFTMCVYIRTGETSWMYANEEGFSFYKNEEDYEGAGFYFDASENTAEQKAEIIKICLETAGIKAYN